MNPYAEESQLKIAYSRYLNKKYTEALGSFSDFERSYPTSSHLPFVQYYRGMSYLEQMRSVDRDQSVTEKANDFFQVVTDRYRDSPFATLAEEKNRLCRESMAAHELYVIDFQLKRYATMAAKARLRLLIEEYPETDSTVFALERLQSLLDEEGKKDIADLAPNPWLHEKPLFLQRSPSQPRKQKKEREQRKQAIFPRQLLIHSSRLSRHSRSWSRRIVSLWPVPPAASKRKSQLRRSQGRTKRFFSSPSRKSKNKSRIARVGRIDDGSSQALSGTTRPGECRICGSARPWSR